MSLFIFCGYYLLHAISKNSFLAELCILVPVHVAAEQYLIDYKNPNSVIENSVCVYVCAYNVQVCAGGTQTNTCSIFSSFFVALRVRAMSFFTAWWASPR